MRFYKERKMYKVKVGPAIIAGIIGTIAMTVLMFIAPYLGLPEMNIINMLGTMFTTEATAVLFLGVIIHFMLGAVFGLIYAWLWTKIGKPNVLWGAIFGVVHGVIAIVMMPVLSSIYPRAEIDMTALFAVGLLMGHIVFGIVVALVYKALYGRVVNEPLPNTYHTEM
jgi:uncharacterized membrane protein YagU involved in acid resistance